MIFVLEATQTFFILYSRLQPVGKPQTHTLTKVEHDNTEDRIS
jgi:hypothetical protein